MKYCCSYNHSDVAAYATATYDRHKDVPYCKECTLSLQQGGLITDVEILPTDVDALWKAAWDVFFVYSETEPVKEAFRIAITETLNVISAESFAIFEKTSRDLGLFAEEGRDLNSY